jgi:hypothetical protein
MPHPLIPEINNTKALKEMDETFSFFSNLYWKFSFLHIKGASIQAIQLEQMDENPCKK